MNHICAKYHTIALKDMNTTNNFQFLVIFAQYFNILPQNLQLFDFFTLMLYLINLDRFLTTTVQNFTLFHQLIWVLQLFSNFSRFFPKNFSFIFTPKIVNLGRMKLDIIAYTFKKIVNSHCSKLYLKTTTYMDTINTFQFLTIFAHNFTFSPKNGKFWN